MLIMCNNYISLIQFTSVIFVLIGAWLLAFGLRIKEGIAPELKKELDIEKMGLISPSDVRQRPFLFRSGLALISFGALLEIFVIACT